MDHKVKRIHFVDVGQFLLYIDIEVENTSSNIGKIKRCMFPLYNKRYKGKQVNLKDITEDNKVKIYNEHGEVISTIDFDIEKIEEVDYFYN